MRSILARFRRLLPAMVLLTSACQSAPTEPAFAPLVFADRGQFKLDAGSLEVVSLYRPPLRAPNVEHEFPYPPAAAARGWAADRLRSAGRSRDRAVFTIADARVVETKLPRQAGLPGVVRDDQSERYDATLSVELAILSGDIKVGRVFAEANVSRSVPESITVNGRRQVWWEMTAALMEQIDRTLEAEIRRNLGRFILP